MTRRLAVGVVLATLTAGCGRDVDRPDSPPPASWEPEAAPLVYTARRVGKPEIYFQDGLTSTPRLFIDTSAARNIAQLSPDGARIAFQVRHDGAFEIHVANADGSGDRNLTANPAHDVLPQWSPDGTRIAFMSTRGYELGGPLGPFPGHLYVVGADGAGLRQLTKEPLTSSLGPQDWSPDGRTLLLSRRTPDGGLDLYALDVESGAETRLTRDPGDEYGAAFSPDGGRIALHIESDGVSHIAVMAPDGTGREILTTGPGLRYGPQWSPDGEWLLFTTPGEGGEPGQNDLRAIRIHDRHQLPILVTPEDEREGRWLSPR